MVRAAQRQNFALHTAIRQVVVHVRHVERRVGLVDLPVLAAVPAEAAAGVGARDDERRGCEVRSQVVPEIVRVGSEFVLYFGNESNTCQFWLQWDIVNREKFFWPLMRPKEKKTCSIMTLTSFFSLIFVGRTRRAIL